MQNPRRSQTKQTVSKFIRGNYWIFSPHTLPKLISPFYCNVVIWYIFHLEYSPGNSRKSHTWMQWCQENIGLHKFMKGGRVEAEPLPGWLKGCRGRRMEAQWSPQWSLNRRYWSAKGSTMVVQVQGRQKRRSNWYTVCTAVRIFTGRPMSDHYVSILQPRWCTCFHLPPLSNLWATDLLGDLCATVLNMASMAGSERPVYQPWTTYKATVRPPFCLQWRPGQFCGRTVEAQKSQPQCKGGIITDLYLLSFHIWLFDHFFRCHWVSNELITCVFINDDGSPYFRNKS